MTSRLICLAALLLPVPCAFSQGTPAPSPAPASSNASGPSPVRHASSRMREDRGDRGMPGAERHGPGGPMMPEGTWWRSPEVVSRIGLSADQQKRIDDIFLQSRVQLIDLHASLEKEELLMEPLMDANPIDQAKALAQIGKIADTRAELEKTDAKMLLSIRGVLTADQWTKLRGPHPGGRGGDMRGRRPDGQHGPARGPGGEAGPPPQMP